MLTGLRDDERRIAVVGLSPYRLKLLTFTLSGAPAGLGGVTYARVGGQLPGPFGQPLFVLGALFVLAVYFAPGGLAGLARRLAPLRRAVVRG